MKRATLVICLVAIMLLALTAASAYANDPPQGTVYGQATMQPTVALSISGYGMPGNPLSYHGTSGSTDYRYNENNWSVVVRNDGDTTIYPMLTFGTNPTLESDSNTQWTYGEGVGVNQCEWDIGQSAVPASSGSSVPLASMLNDIAPTESKSYGSSFTFPTNYTGGTFDMTAVITAGS